MKENLLEQRNDPPCELRDSTSELKTIAQDVRYLLTAFTELRQDFNQKARTDESNEQLIKKLNEELQLYHNDLYLPTLHALFTDLIALYDDLNMCIDNINSMAVEIPNVVLPMLITFEEAIIRMLRHHDVNPSKGEENSFLASRQRTLRIITTSDMEKDNCIARRVRMGFEYRGKLLRPELVDIYKYVAPLAQEE